MQLRGAWSKGKRLCGERGGGGGGKISSLSLSPRKNTSLAMRLIAVKREKQPDGERGATKLGGNLMLFLKRKKHKE